MPYALLFLIVLQTDSLAQVSYEKVKNGQYKVGFTTLYEYDKSRPSLKEQPDSSRGRIVPINVWYPSSKRGTEMTIKDYINLIGQEIGAANLTGELREKAVAKFFEDPAALGGSREAFDEFLLTNRKMAAKQNASLKPGNFPIVLLFHLSAVHHSFMAEYLASYGFIVMHAPMAGSRQKTLDVNRQGVNTQIDDMRFAIRSLRQHWNIDTTRCAVIGISFGAQSATGYAIRSKNVAGIVSLDGGIGSDWGGRVLSRLNFYDKTKIISPILHLFDPHGQGTDLTWLKNEYTSTTRTLIPFKNMQHGHFSAYGPLSKFVPGILGKGSEPKLDYEAVLQLTLDFLRKHLQGTQKNLTTLNSGWVKDVIELNPGVVIMNR